MSLTTLDFETEAIGPRPDQYPPKPVGLALRHPDGTAEYLSWGHPTGNNSTFDEARRAYHRAIDTGEVLFHNGAFDIEVACKHFGLPWPRRWHDTLFILYLTDPHAFSYALKPAAQRVLGMAPDEQDDVRAWVMANVPGATKKNFGAHISKCPAGIVAPYAIGDVERTFLLFKRLYPFVQHEMPVAYARELALCPFLLDAERRGVRVDRELLHSWQGELAQGLSRADQLLRDRLNAPGLSLDADHDLADALDRAGVMRGWEYTDGTQLHYAKSGSPDEPVPSASSAPFSSEDPVLSVASVPAKPKQRSVAKGALSRFCLDQVVLDTLLYRNTAATMLRTFVEPWLEISASDGRLHTKWHQVRGQDANGTRTGRIASSNPNLANIPNPKGMTPPLGCPFLPSLRLALLPEQGHAWLSADYSQQELRWAAHFEGKDLQDAYRLRPTLDLHEYAKDLVKQRTGIAISRKTAKTIAFATIYGAGSRKLAEQLDCTVEDAITVKDAYFTALPGLLKLGERVKHAARVSGYVTSAGGRIIRLEPSKIIDGRMRDFDYKMLNHLVQGTSADQTKQAIVNFCTAGTHGLLLGQTYDELHISVPKDVAELTHVGNTLALSMRDALPCDVPMRMDFEVGNSWGGTQTLGPLSSATEVLKELA